MEISHVDTSDVLMLVFVSWAKIILPEELCLLGRCRCEINFSGQILGLLRRM